jgi:hypothetical protein
VATSSLPEDLKLLTASSQALASKPLPDAARRFLTEAGLPWRCAPCLCFEEVGKSLPRIWEVYSPGQWKPEEKVSLEHYLMLGSDGSGNPICLDDRDGRVVMLDHELLFAPKARDSRIMFVNTSVPLLAECLLAIESVPAPERLDSILQADPPAANKGAFWYCETIADTGKRPWWKCW